MKQIQELNINVMGKWLLTCLDEPRTTSSWAETAGVSKRSLQRYIKEFRMRGWIYTSGTVRCPGGQEHIHSRKI